MHQTKDRAKTRVAVFGQDVKGNLTPAALDLTLRLNALVLSISLGLQAVLQIRIIHVPSRITFTKVHLANAKCAHSPAVWVTIAKSLWGACIAQV